MGLHMLFIRNIFFFSLSASSVIDAINSLQDSIVDSGILITEEIIRNTTNKLFSSLKLKRDGTRLKQYIIMNKHFASITIQEHDNLKEISRLSRANTENNGSTTFMTAINELLNNDNHSIEENGINHDVMVENQDDHIVDIIETFLKRLRHARELLDASSYVNINENVLKLIKEAIETNATDKINENYYYTATNATSKEIEFWKPSGRRIYAGDRTKIKHFPFMASIQMFGNFQCAGSIIKSDLIITASSCLQIAWNNRFFRENPAFLSVRVGSSFYSGGGEVISVLEVYFHPSYDPKTLRNNICIMRLTRKIKFSWRARRRVRKIDIDRHASKLPFNTPGITILGWGAKGRSNVIKDPWTNILSYAVLDIYPLRECQEIYSKQFVTNKNFCAGFMSRGGGACNRDIGDPGIDDGILMGVVSFGSPVCGAADAPTVFTKLGYYADWIDSIMDQKVPYSKKRTTPKPKTPPPIVEEMTLATTTFKIPPMGGIMKPIAINEIEDTLRMFDDNLFNEFMRTIFDSKEMAEYQDVFKEVKQDMVSKIIEDDKNLEGVEKQVEGNKNKKLSLQVGKKLSKEEHSLTSPFQSHNELDTESATKILDFDAESDDSADYNKKLVINEDNQTKSDKVDNNIAELIKNIDLKKIIAEESVAAQKTPKEMEREPILIDKMGFQLEDAKKNESVLTLLYLSEENKDKDTEDRLEKVSKERKEEDEEKLNIDDTKGLSIASDPFLDMTRSKSKTSDTFNGLPEKEFYEILSEVIDDEIRNKKATL